METKTCGVCHLELPITEFHRNRSAKDGLQYHCKECTKNYDANKKARNKESTLKRVYSNPELAKYTPRQLMEELKARGFKWDYMLEPQRKIMFEKI